MHNLIVIDEKNKQLKDLPSTKEGVEVYELSYLSEVIVRIASGELETIEHSNFKMNAFLSHSAVRLAENFRANKHTVEVDRI